MVNVKFKKIKQKDVFPKEKYVTLNLIHVIKKVIIVFSQLLFFLEICFLKLFFVWLKTGEREVYKDKTNIQNFCIF